MRFDMHFHVSPKMPALSYNSMQPQGCVISRSMMENPYCLQFATSSGNACALYADPNGADWNQILELVESGAAISYNHIERFGKESLHLLTPLLAASERNAMPVILHISRHDKEFFDAAEASLCIEHIVERYPMLKIVISHLGGENFGEALRWGRTHANIHLDTSRAEETARRTELGCASEVLRIASDAIGTSRLVYVSDLTWPFQCEQDALALNVIEESFVKVDANNILWSNGRKLVEPFLLRSS